jgi:hypothetical protein
MAKIIDWFPKIIFCKMPEIKKLGIGNLYKEVFSGLLEIFQYWICSPCPCLRLRESRHMIAPCNFLISLIEVNLGL